MYRISKSECLKCPKRNDTGHHSEITGFLCGLSPFTNSAYVKYNLSKKKTKAPCSLNGIEINEISYNVAQDWTKKYDQVNVMLGDAFKLDYNPYTVLFMGRPFLPVTFMQFIEAFEAGLDHPITLIYWVDQQSGYMLKNRPGWKMLYREKLTYIKGLRVARTPQGYSIWTYDPSLR